MKTLIAAALLLLFSVTTASTHPKTSDNDTFLFHPGGRYNPAVRQGSISAGLFTCSSSNSDVKSVCGVVFSAVDKELRTKSLVIQRNALLLNYDDPNDYDITTGHSCSVTAKRRHTSLSAKVTTKDSIKLSGNALNEPAVAAIRLPVHLHGSVDIRYRFGGRVFGKCRRYGRDSATANGDLSTVAEGALAVSLKPSFRRLGNGDFELTIEPRVSVLFELENTDLKLKLSGQSRFTKFWIAIKGLFAGSVKVARDLFKGRSLRSTFKGVVQRLNLKIGHILVLAYFDLPAGLRSTLESQLLSPFAQREANKYANKLAEDVESKLNREIRRMLGTDANGRRRFVISKSSLKIISDSKGSIPRIPRIPGAGLPRPPFGGIRRCRRGNCVLQDLK